MKTTFSRQLALTAGMILLSFVLLGCSFTSLFYNYMLRNEKTSLSTNAEAVASYVSTQSTLSEIDDWERKRFGYRRTDHGSQRRGDPLFLQPVCVRSCGENGSL